MRILILALPRSPHSIRHINHLAIEGWEVHVVPANESPILREELLPSVTVHELGDRLTALRFGSSIFWADLHALKGRSRSPTIMLDGIDVSALPGVSGRAWWFADLIDRLRPDVVHSFTITQSSYLALAAKALLDERFPPWLVSNWGIDIHFDGQHPSHSTGIRAVLANCDYYTAECGRDYVLAKAFGFAGEFVGIIPIGGGFDLPRLRSLRQPGRTSARRILMLKGYQHRVGRALCGLRAIEQCADVLKGFRVLVYAADGHVAAEAHRVVSSSGCFIDVLPHISYEELMRAHGRARASIGLSLSDGISTSALEAMIMGSFPIQSNSSCLDEWVRDGEGGLLVDAEDVSAIAEAIRLVVSGDELVDRGAELNDEIVRLRLDKRVVHTQLVEMYRRVAEGSAASSRSRPPLNGNRGASRDAR